MKPTPEMKLAQIDESRQRWQRRLTRATNALAKLERQRKRLAKLVLTEASKDAPVVAKVKVKKPAPQPAPKTEDVTDIPVTEVPIPDVLPGDDLTIPTFLKRGREMQKAIDTEVAAANARIAEARRRDDETAAKHKAEAEEKRKAKARGRIAKLKAKQRGDLSRMPLTGRAALDAIKRGHV